MRSIALGPVAAAVMFSMPLQAEEPIPSIAEIHADPIAAFQGVWESRFCSKDYQWKVEGRVVRLHRRESSHDPYINRHAVGDPVILLEGPWDQSDRGVRLYASFVDPGNGYQSKGNAAALTSYVNNGITYLSFNEMIRPEEKRRQCGGSTESAARAKPKASGATPQPAQKKAPTGANIDNSDASPAAPKGPTPNQLKYQRELAQYNARLAEIERIKADTASKHAADTAAAAAELARHEREMAHHVGELAAAKAALRKYEEDLAAHQAQVRAMETKHDREAKVDWREAVVVCTLNPADGQTRFGNWRCDGPLQMTYAKLGSPGQAVSAEALIPLSQACGGAREAVRDLGLVSDARLFGCSYGIHPKSTSGFPLDAAAKHGIGYVPGRATYRCPTYKSGCRSQ